MARFWIGTSGWQYRHWRQLFYPREVPQQRWLDFYMQHFRTVEINSSFYRQPAPRTWDGWRSAAAEDFRFAVKANRFLTHILRLRGVEQPLRRFLEGASRLEEHLGPILFQLPPNFQRSDENQARLARLLELLPGDKRFAVEFRHSSWFAAPVYDLLRHGGVAFCSFDMPDLECPLLATAPHAYVRFHGPGETYVGNYSDEALEGWAQRLLALSADLEEVWVYFNNDIGGHAVRNAAYLRQRLE